LAGKSSFLGKSGREKGFGSLLGFQLLLSSLWTVIFASGLLMDLILNCVEKTSLALLSMFSGYCLVYYFARSMDLD